MPVVVWHKDCFCQGACRSVSPQGGLSSQIREGGVYETESTLPIRVYWRRPRYEHNQCAGPGHRSTGGGHSIHIPRGGTKFPPGKYVIHVLNGSDLTLMEIQSADGRTSALFEVREAQDSTSPKNSELVFNHYGSRYFLSKLFDEGEKVGSAVVESGYSKQYASGGASDGEKDVPASHPGN